MAKYVFVTGGCTTVLKDGSVLIAGGYSVTQSTDPSVPWVEIFR